MSSGWVNEFYRLAIRNQVYRCVDEPQADLDLWIEAHDQVRTQQGRWCYGKAPMQTLGDGIDLAKEKTIAAE